MANRRRRKFEVDETTTVFRRIVVVGDHDPEPTDDITIVSSPSDMKRREIAKEIKRGKNP